LVKKESCFFPSGPKLVLVGGLLGGGVGPHRGGGELLGGPITETSNGLRQIYARRMKVDGVNDPSEAVDGLHEKRAPPALKKG
jgi:hypothetical protein